MLEGDPLTIQVQVLGNPKPTVKWFFEDKPVKESDFLKITTKGDWHKLSIDEVALEDEGFYKCFAENELGTAETETEVLVEGKWSSFLTIVHPIMLISCI